MVIIGSINLLLMDAGCWFRNQEPVPETKTKNFFSRQNQVQVLGETLQAYYPLWSDKLQ
jgi:hypothetical protein